MDLAYNHIGVSHLISPTYNTTNSSQPISSLPTYPSETRCGYVALVGRPNAGKSTLFNAFLGQRLSIVTAKPQTTRGRVLGVLTRPQSQVIFLDTPGLLEPSYKLHESMERQIEQAAREADVALLLIDASQPRDRAKLVRRFLEQARTPLLQLNKIDLLGEGILEKNKTTNTERIQSARTRSHFRFAGISPYAPIGSH